MKSIQIYILTYLLVVATLNDVPLHVPTRNARNMWPNVAAI